MPHPSELANDRFGSKADISIAGAGESGDRPGRGTSPAFAQCEIVGAWQENPDACFLGLPTDRRACVSKAGVVRHGGGHPPNWRFHAEPDFDDLAALDALHPRLLLLQQLTERAEDSVLALGSDLMQVALEGYSLLKVSGRSESLKGARQALSARFARGGREAAPAAEATDRT